LLSDDYSPASRNKLVALAFKEAGLVERFGSGIHRILASCRLHGGCEAFFASDQQGFKVVLNKTDLKTDRKTDLKTNGWRSVVSEALVANPSLTVTALAKMLGKGITVTKQYVATLKKEGAIRRVGPDKGGKWEVIAGQ
jgi:ATP-dependent DNA helicase RecG